MESSRRPISVSPSQAIACVLVIGMVGIGMAIGVAKYGSVRSLRKVLLGESILVDWPEPLGSIPIATSRTATMRVRNLYGQSLRLAGLRFSCDCIKCDDVPATVEPGKTIALTVSVEARKEGPQSYKATLFCDLPEVRAFGGNVAFTGMRR